MKGEWAARLERTRQLRLKVRWAGVRLKWSGLAGESWPGVLVVAEMREISAC
jgi:hypothetical protein